MKCAHPIEINKDYIDFSDKGHGPSHFLPRCTHFTSNTSGGSGIHLLTGIRRAMCVQIVRRYERKTVFRIHFASCNANDYGYMKWNLFRSRYCDFACSFSARRTRCTFRMQISNPDTSTGAPAYVRSTSTSNKLADGVLFASSNIIYMQYYRGAQLHVQRILQNDSNNNN